jgi:hypothetical protein
VLFERIRNAGWRFWKFANFAAQVAGFNALDAALKLADIFEILINALFVAGAEIALKEIHFSDDPIQDALVVPASCGTLLVGGAGPEQHVERHPRVRRFDRKVYLANSHALALAGIRTGSPDPAGIVVERLSDGEPTGALFNPVSGAVESTVLVRDNV